MSRISGLYGKLPSKADFVNRNLPSTFVRRWTTWLDAVLSEARRGLGEAWLARYLSSPPWRFVAERDLIGPFSWIGVMASSIDEVKRSYPIVAVIALDEERNLADLVGDPEVLLNDMEALLLGAIDGALEPDLAARHLADLSMRIDTLYRPPRAGLMRAAGDASTTLRLGSPPLSIAAMLATLPALEGDARRTGASCWWQHGWGSTQPTTLLCRGLPSPRAFAGLLDGLWSEHGFRPMALERTP